MKKQLFLCLLLSAATLPLWAQQMVIQGSVKHKHTHEPVPAASVVVKGGTAGTFTDAAGNFRLAVATLPVTVQISSAGFETLEVRVDQTDAGWMALEPFSAIGQEVVVSGTRTPIRLVKSPVSLELIGSNFIRHAPSESYYGLAAYKKGVDITTSSLTFKTISTRGFNGSGSARVNQLVDGMDNQAPGLNFFVGNFAGLTELDVESIELLPGASSALYGPGGMNGTVLISSKNPFQHQGLSVQLKEGRMHVDKRQRSSASPFHDFSLRWAKAFRNKWAFKIGAQYLSADDWLAGDSSNYRRLGNTGKVMPGTRQTDPNYDGINVYGDETTGDIRGVMQAALQQNPGLQPVLAPFLGSPQLVSRTGYAEREVIDPETKNIKLSGAVHYKLNEKLEAQLMGYWATGNTVYTGNNRYVLKNINIGQYKLELRHPRWFVRGYTTQEDAGEAYSATVTTQLFNEAWKRSFDPNNLAGSWYPQYGTVFITGAATVFQQVFAQQLAAGKNQQEALAAAQAAVVAAAPQFHQAARAFADKGRPEPGSAPFKQLFDQVRKEPIPRGGRFLETSQLWMGEGQYDFSDRIRFAQILVGGNFKRYILNSEGTLFIDTTGPITINETGAYAQVTKPLLNDRLTLSFSGRYDKNEDFKGRFTPRATALIKLAADNNLRLSYQTAYRFPTTQQKFIRLNVGDYTLLGGLPWVMDYMTRKGGPVHELVNGLPASTPYRYKELKPESVRSFEVGYKGIIAQKLLLDVYGYWAQYKDFLGRNALIQPANGTIYSTVVNSSTRVKTYGFGLGADYRWTDNTSLFVNLYSDRITDVPSGFQAFFNTPPYRLNAGIVNTGLGRKKLWGFSALFRWQDAFAWEGELANGPVDAFSTVDAQISYKLPRIKSSIRLGGTNILNRYYKNAYAHPEIGGLYYVSYLLDLSKS